MKSILSELNSKSELYVGWKGLQAKGLVGIAALLLLLLMAAGLGIHVL